MKPLLAKHNSKSSGGFTLGFSLCREKRSRLAEGESFDKLNTNEHIKYLDIWEYYLLINLGFVQVAVGFETEGKEVEY